MIDDRSGSEEPTLRLNPREDSQTTALCLAVKNNAIGEPSGVSPRTISRNAVRSLTASGSPNVKSGRLAEKLQCRGGILADMLFCNYSQVVWGLMASGSLKDYSGNSHDYRNRATTG